MDTGVEGAVGSFCWVTLATPDPRGAQEYYRSLFGWDVVRDGIFEIFVKDGQWIASFVDQGMDERAKGQPPNWLPFVRVDDASAAAERAKQLGGRQWYPVFETAHSRISLISGVTREIVGIWQTPKSPGGAVQMTPPGITSWFELVTPNPEPAKAFYGSLFGWRFTNEGSYTVLTSGARAIGGVLKMEGDWEDHAFLEAIGQAPGEKWDVPPHWMVFFQVDDCEAMARRAESLGGRVTGRPDTLHTFGQFAVIRDPHGAYFSIFTRL